MAAHWPGARHRLVLLVAKQEARENIETERQVEELLEHAAAVAQASSVMLQVVPSRYSMGETRTG